MGLGFRIAVSVTVFVVIGGIALVLFASNRDRILSLRTEISSAEEQCQKYRKELGDALKFLDLEEELNTIQLIIRLEMAMNPAEIMDRISQRYPNEIWMNIWRADGETLVAMGGAKSEEVVRNLAREISQNRSKYKIDDLPVLQLLTVRDPAGDRVNWRGVFDQRPRKESYLKIFGRGIQYSRLISGNAQIDK
jgi:hypothetical protein